MIKFKKPDAVVYNEETESYDAALKPFGTDIEAPSITTIDTNNWKSRNIQRVNKHMNARN